MVNILVTNIFLILLAGSVCSIAISIVSFYLLADRAERWRQIAHDTRIRNKDKFTTQKLLAEYLSIAPFLRGDIPLYNDSFRRANELNTLLSMRLTPDLYGAIHKRFDKDDPITLDDVKEVLEIVTNAYGKFEYCDKDFFVWFPQGAAIKQKEGPK